MRSIFFVLASLAAVLLWSHCKAKEQYTAETLPAEQLIFRYGGGFTGEYKSYMLLPNGQLFSRNEVIQRLPFRPIKPIGQKLAKDFFDTFKEQKFGELGYDDPGNMTYSIEYIKGQDTSKVVWGGSTVKPTEELRTYWRRAINTFDKQKAPVVGGAEKG